MDIFKRYEELKNNTDYKKFKRDNEDYYLVHIVIQEEQEDAEFGFYNPKTNKIVVFNTNPIKKGEEDDAFNEGKTITKLDLNKVKVNYEDAINEINKIQKENYPTEQVKKKIIILQNLEKEVWNVTLITTTLNVINIRINAETKEIVRKDKTSLMDMTGIAK